jgi:hypothetical protein
MFAASLNEGGGGADRLPPPPTPDASRTNEIPEAKRAPAPWGRPQRGSFRRTNEISEASCACGGLWLRCFDAPAEEALGRALW